MKYNTFWVLLENHFVFHLINKTWQKKKIRLVSMCIFKTEHFVSCIYSSHLNITSNWFLTLMHFSFTWKVFSNSFFYSNSTNFTNRTITLSIHRIYVFLYKNLKKQKVYNIVVVSFFLAGQRNNIIPMGINCLSCFRKYRNLTSIEYGHYLITYSFCINAVLRIRTAKNGSTLDQFLVSPHLFSFFTYIAAEVHCSL